MARSARRDIENMVKKRLSAAAIDSVRVQEDVDSDGEPIFRVTVVMKDGERADRREMLALARHLQNIIKDDRFPLIRYLSRSDARKSEAA
jgi:hypothetical protein